MTYRQLRTCHLKKNKCILNDILLLTLLISQAQSPNCEKLGAFRKLRKTTISFVMSVCPYVRMEQLDSHWTDFHDI